MTMWFWYAIVAAILYGLHQVFTKLAADHIGDGLGGFVVETTAALTIALYLGGCLGNGIKEGERLPSSCSKSGPLSAVPMVSGAIMGLLAFFSSFLLCFSPEK